MSPSKERFAAKNQSEKTKNTEGDFFTDGKKLLYSNLLEVSNLKPIGDKYISPNHLYIIQGSFKFVWDILSLIEAIWNFKDEDLRKNFKNKILYLR